MLMSLFALLLGAASPSPNPAPAPAAAGLPVGWSAAPTDPQTKDEYIRLQRRESDGTESTISASRQVCACQPEEFVRTTASVFGMVPGSSPKVDSLSACGTDAQRIIVTGLAESGNSRRNIEVIAFRRADKFYNLTYSFRGPAPKQDGQDALLLLCPKA